jgi:hypothetical protein
MKTPSQPLLRTVFGSATALLIAACTSTPTFERWLSTDADAATLTARNGDALSTLNIKPGMFGFVAVATWSNRAQTQEPLWIELPANGRFQLLAYEVGNGFVPVAMRAPPDRSQRGQGIPLGAEGVTLLIMTAPLWGPFYLANKRPEQKPSDDCCFIWIENSDTGAVVAGTTPWPRAEWTGPPAPRSHAPVRAGDNDMSVHCTASGQPAWVYRSQCD